ncbi:MAG: tRNA (guanosine(46)-N7)-methyltransferase TrmB [Defluviitaleaceae bacterium]|nr:tRNA (guanosine(46)-N7)-methyltransferase TrmB [Defluviitaleaceae bacterium]
MRIRKKPWAGKELTDNPRIIQAPEAYAGKMAEYFNNGQPIHLEIGCGKGRFISQMAARHPEINHIAMEREPEVLAMAARLSRDIDASLAFLLLDAVELAEYFKPGEISRLYINFCDPWHRRKKWAKRRLTHVNFLAMYEALEIPEIHFKTDNRVLFEFSINQFSERGWVMQNVSLDLHNSGMEDNIMTEYEEKFSAKGVIYRLEAVSR